MGKKIIKILLGVALIPFCLGYTWQLAAMLATVRYQANTPYYFIAGGLLYLTLHVLFNKPILTYVVGHELTHAFFAVLCGGSVKAFHAGSRGGRVTVTKSNFIITLAPYFFPLYTFLVLILYGLARALDIRGTIIDILIFLSGATFAFHLALTIVFLQTDQKDIREQGVIFSYPLIYLFNIAFIALLVSLYLAENMDYLMFLAGGILKTNEMLTRMFEKAYALIHGSGVLHGLFTAR
jgi:hypothetical protein